MPDFSLTNIVEINIEARRLFRDNPDDLNLDTNTDTAKAVLAQQTATIPAELENPATDQVTVFWMDTSDIEAVDCTDDCDFTGPPPAAANKVYEVPFCKEVTFSVDDELLRKSKYTQEETVARLSLKALTELDNWVNAVTLGQMKVNAGVNNYPGPYTYANGTTTIPAAQYNASMVAQVLRIAKLNRMGRPAVIENGELYVAMTQAGFNVGNFPYADQDRAFKAFTSFTSDDFGFVDAGLTEDAFLLRPGSVALLHKYFHKVDEYVAGKVQQNRYSIASRNLNGIIYDAFETQECVSIPNSGGRTAIRNVFKYKARVGFGVSPATDATHPAILSLSKGA